VEMHCNRQDEVESTHTNFINKYVYFLTDLHSSQVSKGKIYRKLVKTYQITFCMYNVLPRLPDYKNWFTLRTSNGARLTDQINIIIIELCKISDIMKKPVEKQTSLEKWSLFFRYASERSHRKMINEIIVNKEEIGMAATLLREISQDEHERARAMSRKKYEMDMYSDYHSAIEDGKILGQRIGMEQGLEQGQKLGLEQGQKQASIQIARNLLAEGSSFDFIQKITGLSLEDIAKLQADS
ncbi:MAG: Rpn family recombination-promoting nuclease/putative transposase, partial [Treponema sp.]|nr:Rpn family recombination-promoting nuclease/putative transposase [Treponema sp.]